MSTSSAGSSSRTDNRFDDYYTEVFIKFSRFVYQIFLLFLKFCLFIFFLPSKGQRNRKKRFSTDI